MFISFQISAPMAIMVACFYLKETTLMKVSAKRLKEAAKKCNVNTKALDKQSTAVALGKHLFEKEIVMLIDNDKLLEYNNLKLDN